MTTGRGQIRRRVEEFRWGRTGWGDVTTEHKPAMQASINDGDDVSRRVCLCLLSCDWVCVCVFTFALFARELELEHQHLYSIGGTHSLSPSLLRAHGRSLALRRCVCPRRPSDFYCPLCNNPNTGIVRLAVVRRTRPHTPLTRVRHVHTHRRITRAHTHTHTQQPSLLLLLVWLLAGRG